VILHDIVDSVNKFAALFVSLYFDLFAVYR
jgi:hypothetical protein